MGLCLKVEFEVKGMFGQQRRFHYLPSQSWLRKPTLPCYSLGSGRNFPTFSFLGSICRDCIQWSWVRAQEPASSKISFLLSHPWVILLWTRAGCRGPSVPKASSCPWILVPRSVLSRRAEWAGFEEAAPRRGPDGSSWWEERTVFMQSLPLEKEL